MKRNFLLFALLLSILFWGVNAAAFAQDQVTKDTVMHKVKKEVIKKGDVKKGEVKKEVTKTVETKNNGIAAAATLQQQQKHDTGRNPDQNLNGCIHDLVSFLLK